MDRVEGSKKKCASGIAKTARTLKSQASGVGACSPGGRLKRLRGIAFSNAALILVFHGLDARLDREAHGVVGDRGDLMRAEGLIDDLHTRCWEGRWGR
jgi:hypothetical protein